jgi:hypothetical protein
MRRSESLRGGHVDKQEPSCRHETEILGQLITCVWAKEMSNVDASLEPCHSFFFPPEPYLSGPLKSGVSAKEMRDRIMRKLSSGSYECVT